jgi:cysteine-rich repeat protein
LSLFLLSAAPARAVDESDFCGSGDDPCVFSGAELTVSEDTTLDFGSRTLIMAQSKRINVTGGRTLTILAGGFTMQTGARIGNAQTAIGASVTVTTSGDIRLEKGGLESRSRIELPGTVAGGDIQFTAGGNIVVDGELRVNGVNADAPGGFIDLDAGGDITIGNPVNLSGGLAEIGGQFNLSADGSIVISGPVDVSGGLGGGGIDISALGSLSTTSSLDVRGRAAGSFGGEILVAVEGALVVEGKFFVQGVGGIVEGGGTGGEIDLSSGASMLLNEVIDLSGGAPEGDGGFADFLAEVDIIQKRQMIAVGAGTGGSGGVVSYEAGRILSFESLNDVGGSLAGGDFTGTSRGEVQVKSDINANGDGEGGSGGTILLDGRVAGVEQVSGSVTVSATLRTRGDSSGGGISIVGCNVTIAAPAVLNNFGAQASNAILASGLMTILGNVQALPADSGTNTLQFRDLDKQPVIPNPNLIDPMTAPTRNPALPGCEPPPPLICGNGDATGVEGCDDGNLDSCDGCSGGTNPGPGTGSCHTATVPCCQVESCGNGRRECDELCDDGNVNDGDGCDSNCTPTGCGNGRVTTTPVVEECDDGNTDSGDGCSATCIVEPPPGCGDGARSDTEECDDGDVDNCDGCSKICVIERCGNGAKECAEVCDDGGTVACDGECAADCSHVVVCGDGTPECDEQCDSGAQNGAPGSGCSAFCRTCDIGSGGDCPCGTDFDCAPTGRCAGLACLSGACASVDVPVCNDNNACNGVEACVDGACTVPTAPGCADDDPCTDDSCNPAGGANACPHTRKTGFAGVSCRLDFVVSRADTASVEELPTKLRAKILKLASGARDRINTAETDTRVKRQRKLLKAAEAQLSKLLKAINKGLAKGQIAEALATRFVQEVDGARTAARTLRAGITG